MKKSKWVVALLCSTMLLSMFSGCAKTPKSSGSSGITGTEQAVAEGGVPGYMNETGYPITKEKIKISVMGKKDPGATEWNELEIFKRLSEMTNIEFEFDLSEATTFTEKKNLALAGGEYPDLILRGIEKSDEETYGPQGVFLDLRPLIEQYAPNLQKLLDENPQVRASITSMGGAIYGLPYYFKTATLNPHLAFYDSKWLENVGMEEPTTTEGFYEMLKAFKEQDANGNGDPNDEIPYSSVGFEAFELFLIPAFTGLTGGMGFDIKDGEAVYIPALPEYKDYLMYCNKLYSEGLIDPEFLTQTAQQWQAKVKSGICGVYNASPTMLPPETTSLQVSLMPLTSPTNDERAARVPISLYTGRAVITKECEYPEAVMRLLDMFYATPENAVEGFSGQTVFLGYENEHWKYTDNTKEKYEFIDPIVGFADINKSVSVNMELPGVLNFMAMPANHPLMEMKVKGVAEKQMPYLREGFPINARYTQEESEIASLVENDLLNYVTQMSAKFIVGDESFDHYDKFLKELESMRLDEILKIKNDVYARWNKILEE